MRPAIIGLLVLAACSTAPTTLTDNPISDPEIRLELIEMLRTEQFLRGKITGRGVPNELSNAIEATDRYHAGRLEHIIEEIGWPTKSKVGEDGAHAAWSIVQHAVFNPRLMLKAQKLMKAQLGSDEISDVHFAYLNDRIASVLTLDQQHYGIVRDVLFGMSINCLSGVRALD